MSGTRHDAISHQVIDLRREGCRLKDIVEVLNDQSTRVTMSKVWSILKNNGLTERRGPQSLETKKRSLAMKQLDRNRDAIVKKLKHYVSYAQIARDYDVSYNSLRTWLKENDLHRRQAETMAIRKQAIINAWDNSGKSMIEIAATLGENKTFVWKTLHENGRAENVRRGPVPK